ncbi:unnamed protein product [Heterobilharzia americana]|nr:unnamed protein product [Heterobilharzia americana]
MFDYPTYAYGPSVSEIKQLKQGEIERRKKLRILQVRTQARENAIKVRKLYDAKKQQLSDIIAKDLQTKRMEEDMRLLEEKKAEYYNVISQSGMGQKSAKKWHDPTSEMERNLCLSQTRAEDRFNFALSKLHEEKRAQEIIKEESEKRIKEVRNAENKRAALIASLPPPKDVLLERNVKSTVVHEPLVLVYDAEARNTIHSQNLPSKVMVSNTRANEDEAVGNSEVQNANISAQKEEERMHAMELANNIHAREDLIKADMRGRQAMRRERVHQHYQALLSRLDEIGRNETLLRRSQLYSGMAGHSRFPNLPGGFKDEAVVNRRLEKVFEDELLHQLANINYKECINTVDDDNLMNGTNEGNITLNVEGECENSPTKDMPTTADYSVEDQISLVNDQNLKLSKSDSTPSDENISIEEKTVSTEKQQSVKSADLGPGERPILPDIRRCRMHSGSLRLTNALHHITSCNTASKSVSGILNTSFQSFSSSKASLEQNPTSTVSTEDESLQLRQRILDDELDMIDRRINRLRLSCVWDSQEKQFDSIKSIENLNERDKTTENITPRSLHAIEGCVNGDDSVGDAKNSLGSSGSEKEVVTVRPPLPPSPTLSQPINAAALNKFSSKSVLSNQLIDASVGNTTSTVVKYCISQPITGVLAERAHELVRAQKADMLNRKKLESNISSVQSTVHSCNHRFFSPNLQDFSQFSDRNEENYENEDVSHFSSSSSSSSLNESKQVTNSHVIHTPRKLISHNFMNNKKCLSKHSLKNKSEYESSILSETPSLISNKHVQSFTNKTTDEEEEVFHPNDIIIDDIDVDHEEDKTLYPISSYSNTGDIHMTDSRLSNQPREASNIQSPRETTIDLPIKMFHKSNLLTQLDPSSKTMSQHDSLVNIPSKDAFSPPSTSPSLSTSITSPSSTGPKETVLLSSSDKPQISESSTSDSLKAELKALLTSSLITSIISHTSGLTETSDLYKLLSSQSFLLSSTLSGGFQNTNMQTTLNHISSLTRSSSDNETIRPVTTGSSLSSPHLSQSSQHSLVPKNDQLVAPSERLVCDGNADYISPNENSSSKTLMKSHLVKTLKQRVLNKYIRANKEWILNLSGLNQSKLPCTQPLSTSGSVEEFHSLSEATDSNGINWSHTQVDSSRHASQASFVSKPSSLSRSYEKDETMPIIQTYTPLSNHSVRFKPLPRLDEATSEESIHTIQVASDFNNLSNTPSSWTDSRKSSEFGNLSSYSASNSNITSSADVAFKNQSVKSPNQAVLVSGTHSQSSKSEKDSGDDDTVHRLCANIPCTPVEPTEAQIVLCLGSKLSLISSDKSDNIVSNVNEEKLNSPQCSIPLIDQCGDQVSHIKHVQSSKVIDSNGVWDTNSKELEVVTTNEKSSVISTKTSDEMLTEDAPAYVYCFNTVDGNEKDDTLQTRRPSSPAEGAVSEFPSHHYGNVQNFSNSSSLPCVFIEGLNASEVDQIKKETSDCSPQHYASDNNLILLMKMKMPENNSITASLLSFQRNEIHCDVLGDSRSPETDDVKNQFLHASPDSVSAKDISANADILRKVSVNQKLSLVPSKHVISKQTSKGSPSKPSNYIRPNRCMAKDSVRIKSQPPRRTMSRQRSVGHGFLRSSASIVQSSVKSKCHGAGVSRSQKLSRPPSSTLTVCKSYSQCTSVTNSSLMHELSVPVCMLTSKSACCNGTKTPASYGCKQLNPVEQAKALQMELSQWQRKRLGYRKGFSDQAMSLTASSVPISTASCVVSGGDTGTFITADDTIQDMNNQPQNPVSYISESLSHSFTDQSLVDLTLKDVNQSPVSYFVDMDALDSSLTVCSGNEPVSIQTPEMNITVQSPKSVAKVDVYMDSHMSNNKKAYKDSGDLKKADHVGLRQSGVTVCTHRSSSKLHEHHNPASFTLDRHKQAHANRLRVKEFDRIRREKLMKRRV